MITLLAAPCDDGLVMLAPIPATPVYHILVVDDEATIRQLCTTMLTRAGYQVDAAEDGAVAWDVLNAGNFDLLITDNNMPKVSGVELLKKVHAACMTLPVIMATGEYPTDTFIRNPWLKPAGTLLKPYTFAELLSAVKDVLRAAHVAAEPSASPAKRRSQPLNSDRLR